MTRKLKKEKQREISIDTQHKREFENRMCGNKKSYDTDIEAYSAGKFALKGKTIRTYICPICGKWHITTQKKENRYV